MADVLFKHGASAHASQLELLKTPVEQHFPRGVSCYRLHHSGRQVALRDLTAVTTAIEEAVVYALSVGEGPNASSEFGAAYVKETVSISEFEMRPSSICRKLCHDHETVWGICIPPFLDRIDDIPMPYNEYDPLLS